LPRRDTNTTEKKSKHEVETDQTENTFIDEEHEAGSATQLRQFN